MSSHWPLPNISSPSNSFPEWNAHLTPYIEAFLKFFNAHLDEDVCMFVLLYEVKEVRHDVMTYVESYYFVAAKDWWGINELPLCYGVE